MKKFYFFIFSLFFVFCFVSKVNADDFALALQKVERCIAAYNDLSDYTAVFYKRERLDNQNLDPETFFMKFRKPFAVYMHGMKGPYKGYGLLYVDGKWNNQVLAHVSGVFNVFMPSVKLDSNNYFLTKNNRHHVQDVGIGYMINAMRSQFLTAADHGDLTVKYLGTTIEGNEEGDVFEFYYNESGGQEYYCPVGKVVFSKASGLPIHLWAFEDLQKNIILEEYQYSDLKINVGLTDLDFDPSNKQYGFGTIL
jgi:outer membrane lipoprotein-sorting protein